MYRNKLSPQLVSEFARIVYLTYFPDDAAYKGIIELKSNLLYGDMIYHYFLYGSIF